MNIVNQLQVIKEVLEDFKADKLVSEKRVDGALSHIRNAQARLLKIQKEIYK